MHVCVCVWLVGWVLTYGLMFVAYFCSNGALRRRSLRADFGASAVPRVAIKASIGLELINRAMARSPAPNRAKLKHARSLPSFAYRNEGPNPYFDA